MAILLFILGHWYLAAICQTIFLHRYASHGMFTMSPRWEKAFYVLTFLTQGSSYLNPRAYALMHRMHHAYSDTPHDPHSPRHCRSPWTMMLRTLNIYCSLYARTLNPEPRFDGGYPTWPAFDRWADRPAVRLAWVALYVGFYACFATAPWQFLLLPLHVFMGPIHGAIVNWCGHRYGYVNFKNGDDSRNTFFADVLTMGELMQNNHHHSLRRPNFAARRFEWDPTYPLLRILDRLGVIRMGSS